MKKKIAPTLASPQTGLPHQVEVAGAAALPDVVREAVLTGLRQLPTRPALVRITQEEGYRGYTMYRLASVTNGGDLPLCVVGPPVQHPETGSLKRRGDTVDVRYGAYAEEFFVSFFQKSAAHRKCVLYEEFRLAKVEAVGPEK